MSDGYLGKCKTCTKYDIAERESRLNKDPAWKEKELARHREKSRRARALGKLPDAEATKIAKHKWETENKHKKYTHHKVHFALLTGKLTRLPCEVCGTLKVHAHHEDYSKPLDVKWLCAKHHSERHVEINREQRQYT